MSIANTPPKLEPVPSEGQEKHFRLSGSLSANTASEGWRLLTQLTTENAGSSLRIDAAKLDYCDITGASVLLALKKKIADSGGNCELENLNPEVNSILNLFKVEDIVVQKPEVDTSHLAEEVGRSAHDLWLDLRGQVEFLGQITITAFRSLLQPWKIRWHDTFIQMERVGANAVPITALVGFLVGAIIALTAAIPMQQFGADIYVANLVGLAIVRELGPLMGAIMLAGRSGSAFAAELGTMKVNDEVNALKTMGLDPTHFLVVPRLIAGVTMMPFLTVIVNLAGLVGGMVVFLFWLGYPLTVYFNQLHSQIGVSDILGGIVKAFVFGVIVSAVGCMRGLQTKSGPAAVGESTTSSVVTTIVLIVVASGIFTYLYAVLGV